PARPAVAGAGRRNARRGRAARGGHRRRRNARSARRLARRAPHDPRGPDARRAADPHRLTGVIPGWVTRLFDDRYAWVRMALLALSGIAYLVFRHDAEDPFAPIDWVFAIAAIALCPVPVRWPLIGSLASTSVFLASVCFGQADAVVPEVGA